ncbi:unnamed protein product [Mytilus edulis]|uniref:Uncharacterized protein n=1 Tax=Mytilus edulis TaxID=6550 RepID=A0A8S3QJ68_MYTED|nr:unnamed protein product [Mytilus edulis]
MMLNENNELEKELGDLRSKICHSKTKYTQALKMKSYFKGKYKSVNKKAEESKIDSKKHEKEINILQKQVESLQAMADDNKIEKLEMFSGGRYKNEIRQVYMDLVGNGVAIERCEGIVRSVLNNLLNIEVDRLPKKSLASIMAIEAHVLSQAQAAEAMLNHTNNCLHLDGTKKRFTEYAGFQISTEEGSYSLSHQVMPSGDADSYIQATKRLFQN